MDRSVRGAIDAIYDAVLSPRGFVDVPDRVAAATGACAVNIWCLTTDIEVLQVQNCGTDAKAVEEYLNNWIDNDPAHRTALNDGLGRCVTAEELLGDSYTRLPVYEGFYRPNGLARQMGRFDRVESAWLGGLSIQRPESDRDFGSRERELVECLSRHLRQALRLGLRLETASARSDGLAATLDRCRVPVVVCDLESRLQWANHSGVQRLHRSGIRVTARGDRIRFTDTAAQARFAAGQTEIARGRSAPIEIALTASAGRVMEWCVVVPITPETSGERDHKATMALTFHDGNAVPSIDAGRLARALSITPTESQVLAALMHGEQLARIAENQGKALSTVRSYVKSMNQKLDCHGQAELVTVAWARLSRIVSVD